MSGTGWIALALLLPGAIAASLPVPQDAEIDDFVPYRGERFGTFDWNLLQNLASTQRGNLVFSPVSLKLALVLLFEGSQDDTARELANTMHLPVGLPATRDKFTSILNSLQMKSDDYSLNMGTGIFLDNSISARERYSLIVKMFYHTDLVKVNFKEPKQTSDLINNFIKNITNGHIDKVVTDDQSLQDNIMMIVSTMFFHGSWNRQPFLKNQTKIDKFYVDEKSSVEVPFMRSSNKFYYVYADELNAKILRIPYSGHKFAMYIVLPQAPAGLENVLKKITPYMVNRLVWLMQEIPVDVQIPKFKIDITTHLEKNLRQLGIREIFEDTASLDGILGTKTTAKPLVVTDIVQKAAIQVDEEGTLASTTTTIEIGNKINDETFHAKQPFLFFIEDEKSGAILYMGVVNNPLEETGMQPVQPQPQIPVGGGIQPPGLAEADAAAPGIGTGATDRQNFFKVQLLQELIDLNPGNVIVGTSSVKTALLLLAEASAGQTRSQLSSALHVPLDLSKINEKATSFKDASNKTELQSANKLWLDKNTVVYKNYTDAVERKYGSELEKLNFKDSASAITTINNWVKRYTRGRINSIVDPNSLAADTKLLLTTAVYFRGTWRNAFDKSFTRSRCFNVPDVGCQQVPLMETIAYFKYAEVPALDAQVVQIPYTNERISMLVLLPMHQGMKGLNELSRDLPFTPMSAILASLQETEVLLQLPRFRISSKMNLRAALERLGAGSLFTAEANLSAAFPQGAQLGAALHNAEIEVNEEGTIAAAVTGVSVIPLMGPTSTPFRADRPFIFLLLDNHSNNILFAGRFVRP